MSKSFHEMKDPPVVKHEHRGDNTVKNEALHPTPDHTTTNINNHSSNDSASPEGTKHLEDNSKNDTGPSRDTSQLTNHPGTDDDQSEGASPLDEDAQLLADLLGENPDDNSGDDEQEDLPRDPVCQAAVKCVLQSGDYRKVVSHLFGRNKKCTREIPDSFWIKWCRKHYQRYKYRAEEEGTWHTRQLGVVRQQLTAFQNMSHIASWNITLRKKEQSALDAENATLVAAGALAATTAPGVSARPLAKMDAHASSNVGSDGAHASSNGESDGAVASLNVESSDAQASSKVKSGGADASSNVKPGGASTVPENQNTFQAVNATKNKSGTAISNTASPRRQEVRDTTIVAALSTAPFEDKKPITPPSSSASPSSATKTKVDFNTSYDSDVLTNPPSEIEIGVKEEEEDEQDVPSPPVWERFLVPHLGDWKNYDQVRQVLNVIDHEFRTPAFQARDPSDKNFPGIEFLPNFPGENAKKFKANKTRVSTPGASKSSPTTRAGAAKKSKGSGAKAEKSTPTSTTTSHKRKMGADDDFGPATRTAKNVVQTTPAKKRKAGTEPTTKPEFTKPEVSTTRPLKRKASTDEDSESSNIPAPVTPPPKRRRSGSGLVNSIEISS